MRYLTAAIAIAALLGLGLLVWNPFRSAGPADPAGQPTGQPAPGGPPAALVIVEQVTQEEVVPRQSFVGTVQPLRRAAIGSAVDGRVVEVPVDIGDRVAAGQKLAQLLTETMKLELEAASQELALRQEELRELKNGSLPEEIAQARANMDAAGAMWDYLNARYESVLKLRDSNAITPVEFREATSAWRAAKEKLDEAKARYDLAVIGPREERIAQAEAKVKMQAALVQRLEDMIKKHTVIARFNGYVTAKHSEIGQWANRGDLVAEIVALDEVEIEAGVLEDHARYVRLHMPVEVTVPAVGLQFQGYISRINPQADPRTRTVPVKVRVLTTPLSEDALLVTQAVAGPAVQTWHHLETSHRGPLLKAGMLARVSLPTGHARQALLVPKDALVLGGNQKHLWVIDRPVAAVGQQGFFQGQARSIPVETGFAKGRWIEVTGDLQAGDLVVKEGNERLFGPRPGELPLVRWTAPSPTQNTAQLPAVPDTAAALTQ